jgi:hypothetical protein
MRSMPKCALAESLRRGPWRYDASDTSFLADLLREHARRQPGRTTSFIEENAGEHLPVGIQAAGLSERNQIKP